MASPTLELTGAIVLRLKSQVGVTGLVGTRVYDPVPPAAPFPYISIGASTETQDDVDCIAGSEISFRIDVWSRTSGFREALQIAEAVRTALHGYDVELDDNALVLLEHIRTDKMRDPDGLTSHAVVEFRAIVERPADDSPLGG